MDFPYNVGDKVLVRDDMCLGEEEYYYSYGRDTEYAIRCYNEHYRYSGQIVTIDVLDEIDGAYQIEEDNHYVWWAAEMFLPVDTVKREADASLLMNVILGE